MSSLGISVPVVRTDTLQAYLRGLSPSPKRSTCTVSPLSLRIVFSRSWSGVSPETIAHSSPEYSDISDATFLQCAREVQKIRQLCLSFVSSTISRQAEETSLSSPISFSTSSATNSPALMCNPSVSATVFPACAVTFEIYPSSISFLTEIS